MHTCCAQQHGTEQQRLEMGNGHAMETRAPPFQAGGYAATRYLMPLSFAIMPSTN